MTRHQAGIELKLMQDGHQPSDWKSMTGVGSGVMEIRIKAGNEYRIFTVAKFEEAIYVLHVFVKKSKKPPQAHIDIAKKRYNELKERRR